MHSANSLFHFMSDIKYMISALQHRAMCPRYFNEDISYLKISRKGNDFEKIAVLQKAYVYNIQGFYQ